MLADPRVLRLASAVGVLAVLVAWVVVAVTGRTAALALAVLGAAALAAGHVLMHAARAVPAAVLTGLLGVALVGVAVSSWTVRGPGGWLCVVVLSLWVLWVCVGPRRVDDRRRAAERG